MSIDEMALETKSEEVVIPPAGEVQEQRVFQIPEFLKAKTGSGSIESYIEHPMNMGKSEPFARILRGLTGMFNSLDYAIIDIVIGGFQFIKKTKVET